MMEVERNQRGQQEGEGEMEEGGIQTSFRKIEEMEHFGVNKTDIMKLKAGGYHTIEAVSLLKSVIYCLFS